MFLILSSVQADSIGKRYNHINTVSEYKSDID